MAMLHGPPAKRVSRVDHPSARHYRQPPTHPHTRARTRSNTRSLRQPHPRGAWDGQPACSVYAEYVVVLYQLFQSIVQTAYSTVESASRVPRASRGRSQAVPPLGGWGWAGAFVEGRRRG